MYSNFTLITYKSYQRPPFGLESRGKGREGIYEYGGWGGGGGGSGGYKPIQFNYINQNQHIGR